MITPRPSAGGTGRGGSSAGDVLSQRALNRALLARQLLLERHTLPAEAAIAHLIGLQAQAPNPPYVGLWSRLEGFQPEDLARLITERRAVRIALMRNTVHLVTAEDALTLRPLVQPVFDRDLYRNVTHGPGIRGIDLEALVAAGRALVEERPRTLKELGELLQAQWPDRPGAALAYAIRNQLPLVQVPPRGIWGQSGPAACTTLEAWLGRPLDPAPSPETLVLRYLAAFGPASVRDAQTWSGLTGLRAVFARLRPQLVSFRDERGTELFDLPGAPRPDPDTPAPPRLIAEFDNLILSHADRTRVISDDARRRIATPNGIFPGTILVDGFVSGTWAIERRRDAATLRITPFAPIGERDRAGLAEEGMRLLQFAAADATSHDVEFAPAQ